MIFLNGLSERGGRARKARRGDVIGVSRTLYDHYGIYVDDETIIHFTSTESDISFNNKIQETTFKKFLKGESRFVILDFPQNYGKPQTITGILPGVGCACSLFSNFSNKFKEVNYKCYTPEETILRAKSKLGEKNYSLVFNNCEHFVVWCKTGISESHQVNTVINTFVDRIIIQSLKCF